MNTFGFERFPGVIDKRRRTRDLANPEDQPGCMVECRAVFCPWVMAWVALADGGEIHRGQIIDTSLR
jgi:hypothetical protein